MSQKSCIPVRLRLAKYLHPSGDQCWEWTGAKNEHGYGVIGRGKRGRGNTKDHRVAYETFYDVKLDSSSHVLHRCDNPGCVNPLHLWLGNHRENMNDMLSKGRGSKPPVRRGTANNKAKLDENKIRLIFQLRHTGLTTYQLAELFCVSRVAICCVLNRTTWRHVDVTNHFC
ncbi:MAG: HNH endonuclease [Nitrosomonadales bacterium]|nr:HNH endonuclease [Nitrosomonadales bacterium]